MNKYLPAHNSSKVCHKQEAELFNAELFNANGKPDVYVQQGEGSDGQLVLCRQ